MKISRKDSHLQGDKPEAEVNRLNLFHVEKNDLIIYDAWS